MCICKYNNKLATLTQAYSKPHTGCQALNDRYIYTCKISNIRGRVHFRFICLKFIPKTKKRDTSFYIIQTHVSGMLEAD